MLRVGTIRIHAHDCSGDCGFKGSVLKDSQTGRLASRYRSQHSYRVGRCLHRCLGWPKQQRGDGQKPGAREDTKWILCATFSSISKVTTQKGLAGTAEGQRGPRALPSQ